MLHEEVHLREGVAGEYVGVVDLGVGVEEALP